MIVYRCRDYPVCAGLVVWTECEFRPGRLWTEALCLPASELA